MMRNLLVALIANGAALAANPVKDAVPLFFIANHGQAPPAVRFMAKGSGLTAYFSPGEALLRVAGSSVRMQFEQANPSPRIEGMERLPGHANFLIGAQQDWRPDVPLFGAVVYRELYPGIDMVYGGDGRDLKSEFVVAPGADPSRIRVRYAGAGGVRIEENGALAIPVDGRELREQAPSIYQERSGKRVAVEGRFAVDGDGAVRFLVGDYDVARPLIIDPVLSYSTLLGGSGFDTATALAVDSAGAAYVAGFTESYNFPTANPEQNFNAGGNDVFVAKLNPSGNGLAYCTYVGGSADDRAYGIAVDGNGFAYVTGSTTSGNFPVRNALQSKRAGGRNAFILKLSLAGNSLVFSTYLGGNASDNGNGIAVDAAGNAYVVGDTTSINFPASGMQRGNHGGQDAFVAKVSADGSRLLYSTYLGGESNDRGAGIAVDASGSAYITGSTYSADFPVASAFQGRNAGGQDAFIARLSTDGNSLLFSTYLGGTGGIAAYPEAAQGIALDSQGSAYVTGVTSSADFPLLHAVQTSRRGSTDAFVTKVNASGTLVYSTYLGGSGVEVGNAIAVDSSGSAYVVGYSYSTDLATVSALQAANAGDCDAFLAKLSATGDSLAYLSYLGGNSSDTATAVALSTSGNVYVAGWTLSTNFPLFNPYQSTNAGNYGAFVTKVVFNVAPTNVGVAPNSGSGVSQTFSFQFADANGASDLTSVSALFNASPTVANGCSVTYTRAQNALSLLTDAGAAPAGTITPGSGSQQNSQCVLNGSGSSVSTAGTVLTLNLALTFLPAFSGAKTIYMQATNPVGSSNWQAEGTWTVLSPVLSIAVRHTGNFTQGQAGAAYVVTVANQSAAAATSGVATVTEILPSGLTLVAMTGAGWTCATTTCIRGDPLAAGASYPAITVTVNVAVNATSPLVNQVSVSGGGSASANASDSTIIDSPASNLSVGKPATQSSTCPGYPASLAVDGNTDGVVPHGSVTITSGVEATPWWQVDLGASATVSSIVIWNRTDCCGNRLGDYWVFVSDTPFSPADTPATLQGRAGTWNSHQTTAPNPSTTITANPQGRYVRVQLSGTNYLSLAEVQVFGTTGGGPTISGQVTISGSNTGLGAVSMSLSGTSSASTTTDGSGNYSFSGLASGGNYTVTPLLSGYTFNPTSQPINNLTSNQTANFAATATVSGSNSSVGKPATQSSTYPGYPASLAVDGNTDGVVPHGSITVTSGVEATPWWQVDLGASATVSSIVIWNRTDCCGNRLGDYWVFVSDTPFGPTDTPSTLQGRAGTWNSHQNTAPNPSTTITANPQGRYVRVQLSGTNYLSLAEVQVFGTQ